MSLELGYFKNYVYIYFVKALLLRCLPYMAQGHNVFCVWFIVYSVRNMNDGVLGKTIILVRQWYALSLSSQTLSHPPQGKWRESSSIHELRTNQIKLFNFETVATLGSSMSGADGLA